MASRKNRSGKGNRRSPALAASALGGRWAALIAWVDAHRWHAATIGFLMLFLAAMPAGYWIAQWLEPQPTRVTYARIEDIPGLPIYVETEPDQKPATVEEKPRARPAPPQVAAAAVFEQAWRRNALPYRDLGSRPLIAIVIDD